MESDLKVEIIDNAGHFVFLEQPELFHRAVLDACAPHLTPEERGRGAAMTQAVEEKCGLVAVELKYQSS